MGRKINYYNVYKDDVLVMSNVNCRVAAQMCEILPESVSSYVNQNRTLEKDGSIYHFELSSSECTKVKQRKEPHVRQGDLPMPEGFKEKWDKARFKLNPEAIR